MLKTSFVFCSDSSVGWSKGLKILVSVGRELCLDPVEMEISLIRPPRL